MTGQRSDLLRGRWHAFKGDYVTRRFKRLAALAGLPVIKLHEGHHSAASLAREAEGDPDIRRRTLGHANTAMTSHYTNSQELHQAGEKPQVA